MMNNQQPVRGLHGMNMLNEYGDFSGMGSGSSSANAMLPPMPRGARSATAMAGGGVGAANDMEAEMQAELEREQERVAPWPPRGADAQGVNWAFQGDDLLDAPVQATHID